MNNICFDIINYICDNLDGKDIINLCATSKDIHIFLSELQICHDKKIKFAINNNKKCILCKKSVFTHFYYIILLCNCLGNFPYYHNECLDININYKTLFNKKCPICLRYTHAIVCDICS